MYCINVKYITTSPRPVNDVMVTTESYATTKQYKCTTQVNNSAEVYPCRIAHPNITVHIIFTSIWLTDVNIYQYANVKCNYTKLNILHHGCYILSRAG